MLPSGGVILARRLLDCLLDCLTLRRDLRWFGALFGGVDAVDGVFERSGVVISPQHGRVAVGTLDASATVFAEVASPLPSLRLWVCSVAFTVSEPVKSVLAVSGKSASGLVASVHVALGCCGELTDSS